MHIPPGLSAYVDGGGELQVAQDLLDRLHEDPYFFYSLLMIKDQTSPKYVPFSPTPFQRRMLDLLHSGVSKIIVLKARQIGCTTAVRAWQLREAYFATNAVRHVMFSYVERSAHDIHKLDDYWLKMLGAETDGLLARKCKSASVTEFTFNDTLASVEVMSARKVGGARSGSMASLHMTEFAFYNDPDETLAQVMAGLQGQVVIESTPDKPGDAFHRLCAGAPANGWTLVTSWWFEHPAYRVPLEDMDPEDPLLDLTWQESFEEALLLLEDPDERSVLNWFIEEHERTGETSETDTLVCAVEALAWRRLQIGTSGLEKFRREYPTSLEEAFITKESRYFDGAALAAIRTEDRGHTNPIPMRRYAMGVDVGGGVSKDYSALHVMDADTMDVVYYERNNKLTPKEWTARVVITANRYNQAYVLVESNNHGHVVLAFLHEWGYPSNRLYTNVDGKPWVTSARTKMDAMHALRDEVNSGAYEWLPAETRLELASLEIRGTTPEAPVGQNDDLAMSLVLTSAARRAMPNSFRPGESTSGEQAPSPKEMLQALRQTFPPKKQAPRSGLVSKMNRS